MKKLTIVTLIIIVSLSVMGQGKPKWMGIQMIGNSDKPIIGLFIIDSIKEKKFSYDEHQANLAYADSNTLEKIYMVFSVAKEYDPKKKYDYSFGTFQFTFAFGNTKKSFISTKTPSAVYLQKIICTLSGEIISEAEIIKEVNRILKNINY